MEMNFKFSLIMSTLNRTNEVSKFLDSLSRQSYKNYELIIVDQNDDDRLKETVDKYANICTEIIRLKSERGLSRGRNVGLAHASGDIIAFPDDDCNYPENLLKNVNEWFEQNNDYAGVSGVSVGRDGNLSVGRFDNTSGDIDRLNIWNRMTSIGFFVKKSVVGNEIRFDEKLGVGSGTIYGAAEDIDFPLQLLAHGNNLFFSPNLKITHPPVTIDYDSESRHRGLLYGGGIGYVLEKHKYPLKFVLKMLVRPLGGAIISIFLFNFAKAWFHWNVFRGRLRGMIQ
ncbi:MAG: glycosyltransferase family A protein [Candidatus Zixiibacteriota bacterium]